VYILDTDIFTLAYTRRSAILPLETRISATPPDQLYLSIITVKESLRGALALINRHEANDRIVPAYDLLRIVLEATSKLPIVVFDQECYEIFQGMPPNIKTRHSQDARIAATAIRHSLTVVTRNTQHFQNIPGLQYEDWTRP